MKEETKESGSEGKKHFFDDPANVKKVIRIFIGCCVGLFLMDGVFYFTAEGHRHLSFKDHGFDVEGWFGFYGVYGFAACVLLVLAAKQLRKFLMRDEEYYDR